MDIIILKAFIYGAVMMGSFIAGIFFLKFWKLTKDRFFAMFASAFWLFSIERWTLVFFEPIDETRTWIFIIRLFAFLLILIAVIDKNRK